MVTLNGFPSLSVHSQLWSNTENLPVSDLWLPTADLRGRKHPQNTILLGEQRTWKTASASEFISVTNLLLIVVVVVRDCTITSQFCMWFGPCQLCYWGASCKCRMVASVVCTQASDNTRLKSFCFLNPLIPSQTFWMHGKNVGSFLQAYIADVNSSPFTVRNVQVFVASCVLQLWHTLMPNQRLQSRVSKQWTDIGFQGEDPMTDFRGMGMLGLHNLL